MLKWQKVPCDEDEDDEEEEPQPYRADYVNYQPGL